MLRKSAIAVPVALWAFAVYGAAASAQSGWVPADPAVECADVPERALCSELLALRDKDQIPRHGLIESPNDPALLAEVGRVDAENLARLLAIVDAHGWPQKSQVGERAAGAAWLIVQHADLETQERFLGVMQAAAEAGELEPGLIALTIDRIRVGQGRPQVYGTQFKQVDGELVMEPLEDPERVDERRESVGLPPLAEYEALLREAYGSGGSGVEAEDQAGSEEPH